MEGLGDAVRVLSDEEVRASTYAQVATGEGALAGTDNMLALQLAKAGRPQSWCLISSMCSRSAEPSSSPPRRHGR